MNSNQTDLSISLLSYNNKVLLENCLNSIYKNTKKISFEILLVDNASKDGSVQMVKKEFPKVKVVANKTNKLYIKGHNQNLRRVKGRYFLILNEDVELTSGCLEKMVTFMDRDPQIGLASCRQIDGSGKVDKTCSKFPHPIYEILEISYIHKLFGKFAPFSIFLDNYRYSDWNRLTTRQVDVVPGSFMIGKSELLTKVGLFDQKNLLFFYVEPDYCLRAKKAGYQIYHNADVTIIHLKSKALSKLPAKTRSYLSEYDLLAYYRKYFGSIWWLVLWILLLPNRFIRTLKA
jgi:GT2 family glycosyltransferase